MTRKCVTNEQFGMLSRHLDEFKRRVDEGVIPFDRAMYDAHLLVKGKTFYKYNIDCDAVPSLSEGLKGIEYHKKMGKIEWDPTKVRLHLSPNQQNGKIAKGYDLREELANEPVLNANVLDYLLAHQELIPEEWKGECVYFWGTIYCGSDDSLYVRSLYWSGGSWYWRCRWLGYGWDGSGPAACLQVSS